MTNINQYTLPFREAIPFLDTILGSKLDKKVFLNALEALLEDADAAGYTPQDHNKERISMLQSLIEDRRSEIDDPEDEPIEIDDDPDPDFLDDPEDLDDPDEIDEIDEDDESNEDPDETDDD